MATIRRTSIAFTLLLLIALVATGCGSPASTGSSKGQASTARATATATAPLSPTPQPTVNPALLASCHMDRSSPNMITQAGDLLIEQPYLDPFNYAPVQLPDQTPLKPLQVSVDNSNNALSSGGAQFAAAYAANPGGAQNSPNQFDFVLHLCNSSATTTHVVRSVSVSITALTPYAGQLNVWPGCDGAYPHAMAGGCGGGLVADEAVAVTFAPGAAQGTTMITTESNTHVGGEPLPAHLTPGQSLMFEVGITLPVAAGAPAAYTFAVGFQTDAASVATFGQPASPVLFATVAHTFTGTACNTPAMLAQIPTPTPPDTYYICPQ